MKETNENRTGISGIEPLEMENEWKIKYEELLTECKEREQIEPVNLGSIKELDYKALYELEHRRCVQLQGRIDQLVNAIIGIDCVAKAVM